MRYRLAFACLCRTLRLFGRAALLCLLLNHCQGRQPPDARSILERATEAHGGSAEWQRLKSLQYTKETTLYREDGSVESSVVELHEFQWQPTFSTTISWEKEGITHRIVQDTSGTSIWMDDNRVDDPTQSNAAGRRVEAALYTLSQPFNLLQDIDHARYEGLDTLDGQAVEVVRMDYPGADADTWWYFFDPETSRCVANLVHHAPTYALIQNRSYTQVGPFLLHGKRETYRVNSERQIQYLRARYHYDDYTVRLD